MVAIDTGVGSFTDIFHILSVALGNESDQITVRNWQSKDVSELPLAHTRELQNVVFSMPIPTTSEAARMEIKPSVPWAEEQFKERVSGEPLNPGESYRLWP